MTAPTPITKARESVYLTLIHLAGMRLLWPIVIVGGGVGVWLAAPLLLAAVIFLLKVLLGIALVAWILWILFSAVGG